MPDRRGARPSKGQNGSKEVRNHSNEGGWNEGRRTNGKHVGKVAVKGKKQGGKQRKGTTNVRKRRKRRTKRQNGQEARAERDGKIGRESQLRAGSRDIQKETLCQRCTGSACKVRARTERLSRMRRNISTAKPRRGTRATAHRTRRAAFCLLRHVRGARRSGVARPIRLLNSWPQRAAALAHSLSVGRGVCSRATFAPCDNLENRPPSRKM